MIEEDEMKPEFTAVNIAIAKMVSGLVLAVTPLWIVVLLALCWVGHYEEE